MDASPRPRPPDLEFDPPPAPVRLRDFEPAEHQRLVVNPFLAVLAALLLGKLTVRLIDGPFPPLFVLAALGLVGLPVLIQYHCLDCGHTGAYPYRGRHACPGVLARARVAGARSSIFLTARGQLLLWGWVIASVALLVAIVG